MSKTSLLLIYSDKIEECFVDGDVGRRNLRPFNFLPIEGLGGFQFSASFSSIVSGSL
jgi:hypothetical protein